MKESNFQKDLIRDLKTIFPGSIILKNDPNYIQGIPDLMILYNDKWAALECKKSKDAHRLPKQEYYVEKLNKLSFSSFVYPENKDEVIENIKKIFKGEN